MRARVTRRSFLALLGLAAVPQEAVAAPAAQPPAVVDLLRCPVAGLPYYDHERVADALVAGTRLMLRREPGNPHDRRAIEVFTEDGVKLGYVPRVDNPAVARLMDAGYAMQAKILGPSSGSKRWERLWMAVSMVERAGARTAIAG